jgi:hypothetical protein
MRKISMTLVAVIVILMTSCEKEEITPSKLDSKDKLIECRKCEGSWDRTDL